MKILVGAIFIIGSLLFLGLHTLPSLLKSQSITKYPEIPVNIQHLDLRVTHSNNNSRYHIETEYTYTVDGKHYSSGQAYDPHNSNRKELFEALEKKRESNDVILAYYNPSNPEEAYLSTETSFMQYGMNLLFGSLAAFIGMLATLSGIRELKGSC